jgi:hypothetical protein
MANKKPVLVEDLHGKKKYFHSASEAASALGWAIPRIFKCISYKNPSRGLKITHATTDDKKYMNDPVPEKQSTRCHYRSFVIENEEGGRGLIVGIWRAAEWLRSDVQECKIALSNGVLINGHKIKKAKFEELHLGPPSWPRPMRRSKGISILVVDKKGNKQIFLSCKAAALLVGGSESGYWRGLKKGGLYRGLKVVPAHTCPVPGESNESLNILPSTRPGRGVKVRRSDGEVYESISDAAHAAHINKPDNICQAIKRGGKSGGYNWSYVES